VKFFKQTTLRKILPIIFFCFFYISLSAQSFGLNSETSLGFSESGSGGVEFSPSFLLGLSSQPPVSDVSGFQFAAKVLLKDASLSDSFPPTISFAVPQLNFRLSSEFFRGSGTAVSDRLNNDLIQFTLGRILSDDLLMILDPFAYDGLAISIRGANAILTAEFGYQGFIFNQAEQTNNTRNILTVTGNDPSTIDTSLSFWSELNSNTQSDLVNLEFNGAPNALVNKVQLLLPELIGRQSPFLVVEFQSLLPGSDLSDPIFHSSAIAGITGSLTTRSFYSLLGSYSHIESKGISDLNSFAAILDLRTYVPGRFSPRLGIRGLISGAGFIFPQSLSIVPGYLDFSESSTMLVAADAEGLLWRDSSNSRLGLGWKIGGFAVGKPFEGIGVLNDPALESFTGYLASGFDIGFRYRPFRDVAIDLRGNFFWPSESQLEFVGAELTFEYRY
jgi:hypothetical protein